MNTATTSEILIASGEVHPWPKIDKILGRHMTDALIRTHKVEGVETPKGQPRRYVARVDLTHQLAYQSRDAAFGIPASSVVHLAEEVLDELRDELDEWYNNLPESLQGGEKAEVLQSAIDNLQSVVDDLQSLDTPSDSGVDVTTLVYDYPVEATSRSARRSRVSSLLRLTGQAYRDRSIILAANAEAAIEGEVVAPLDLAKSEVAVAYADALDGCADMADETDFPGMF